jgi:hypothetical protein
VDEKLLDAFADEKSASHDFVAAAVAHFPSVNNSEPRPPKTETDFARGIIHIVRAGPENITGDIARLGSNQPFNLKKIDGTWRLDAIFGRQGMNFDAIGLLELLPQASSSSNATPPK